MKKQIVIDIETMPNFDVVHLLPEPKIDSRLKDSAKIEEARKDAKQAQLDKMALSPLTGKIALIGFCGENSGGNIEAWHNEKEGLDLLYSVYLNDSQIITYNGKGFDLPFIFKRGIILGCKWASIPEMKKFTDRYKSDERHIDLMQEFCNYNEYEKIDNLARFILGEGKIDFDVTKIHELVKTPDGQQQLKEYCQKDCDITWQLARKMGFINDLEGF